MAARPGFWSGVNELWGELFGTPHYPTVNSLTTEGYEEPPGLELLLDQVASERETIQKHVDGLDTKTGVVLGSAGVLVVLAGTTSTAVGGSSIFQVGLVFAAVSALISAAAFFPRTYLVLDPYKLRMDLLQYPLFTVRMQLLDTQTVMVARDRSRLNVRGWLVKAAVVALFLAILFIAIGIHDSAAAAGVASTTAGGHRHA